MAASPRGRQDGNEIVEGETTTLLGKGKQTPRTYSTSTSREREIYGSTSEIRPIIMSNNNQSVSSPEKDILPHPHFQQQQQTPPLTPQPQVLSPTLQSNPNLTTTSTTNNNNDNSLSNNKSSSDPSTEQQQQQQQQLTQSLSLSQSNPTQTRAQKIASVLSLTLENTGSVARDHLANERTWLAWVRTSLSLSLAGIAVTQLFSLAPTSLTNLPFPNDPSPSPPSTSTTSSVSTLSPLETAQIELLTTLNQYYSDVNIQLRASNSNKRFAKPVGGLFVVLGMVTMIIGLHRYFMNQHLMTQSKFSATRLPAVGISLAVGAVGAITFACIVGSK